MADYLLANVPEAKIYGVRRWRSRDENIKHLYHNSRVVFIEGDLLDRSSLKRAIAQAVPDYVFHFAAQSFPETSFFTPVQTLMTNSIGTTNFLEELRFARDAKICDPLIVSVSSSEVYGNPTKDEVPITEKNFLRAANPYSISKVSHDLLSSFYYSAYGLKIVITRLFSHEGSRRGKQFALSSFAHQIVTWEKKTQISFYATTVPLTIKVGNLNSVRTYAHIDDAVHAYWLVATKGKIGECYNIGGNHTCTVGDALENLMDNSYINKDQFAIVVDPDRIRPTDITLQIPDCTKFKLQTGWEPTKTLDDISKDLLNYWRSTL
jgi:GDP-mannose 4,6-dehydratase